MLSALTQCGLLISSYMGQRFSFENPMQAIDSLPRKMRLAKYMNTILQQFQDSLDLPKAHLWAWDLENQPPPTSHAPPGSA